MTYKNQDDDLIDLRKEAQSHNDVEFKIDRVDDDHRDFANGEANVMGGSTSVVEEIPDYDALAKEKVKIKFDKFVNLVATHAYEEILEAHMNDDVIIGTDLLADLANAHEEKSDKKMPFMFIFGIALGVGLTWLLIKY